MIGRRGICAIFGAASLLAAQGTLGDSYVTVDASTPDTTAGTAPFVEIVVYDGTTLPATVIAGCSAPDCMGYDSSLATGTVTHSKNYVGWGVGNGDGHGVYLYVDGKNVASVKSNRLLTWGTNNVAAGPHDVQALAYAPDGTPGWSAPLTITVVK
jgi:hypothetical protein